MRFGPVVSDATTKGQVDHGVGRELHPRVVLEQVWIRVVERDHWCRPCGAIIIASRKEDGGRGGGVRRPVLNPDRIQGSVDRVRGDVRSVTPAKTTRGYRVERNALIQRHLDDRRQWSEGGASVGGPSCHHLVGRADLA